jgi:hypothetical protein
MRDDPQVVSPGNRMAMLAGKMCKVRRMLLSANNEYKQGKQPCLRLAADLYACEFLFIVLVAQTFTYYGYGHT